MSKVLLKKPTPPNQDEPTILKENSALSYLQTKQIISIPGNNTQVRLVIYAPYSKRLMLDRVIDIPEGGIDALWLNKEGYYPLIWQKTTRDYEREGLSKINTPAPSISKPRIKS